MPLTEFPHWDFRGFIGDYVSRQINSDDGRLSVLMSILMIAGISVALWGLIAILVARFV
jgi:hypothetical protein